MKKRILLSMIAAAFAFSGVMFEQTAEAKCPTKGDCKKSKEVKVVKDDKPVNMNRPLNPDDLEKIRLARQAAFAKRLNLSEMQMTEFEKIKADEEKAIKPLRAKIKKEQSTIKELVLQEKEIRDKSMKKLEDILSESQLEELNNIKNEFKEQMQKTPKPNKPILIKETQVSTKAVCPPDCACMCHHPDQAYEPANCKCPCHDKEKK